MAVNYYKKTMVKGKSKLLPLPREKDAAAESAFVSGKLKTTPELLY